MTRPTVLLGTSSTQFGEVTRVVVADGQSAAAISVGADPLSPGLVAKKDSSHPNEDALLCWDTGHLVLVAVADSHFGWRASHELVTALAAVEEIPRDPDGLEEAVRGLRPRDTYDGSSTTLLVNVYDRRSHLGFGLSYGDSSLVVVGPRGARVVNTRRPRYIDPHRPEELTPDDDGAFRFLGQADDLVLVFTDGVNECQYRSPQRSIQGPHLEQLYAEVGPEPERYARELMRMALAGVDGHAGGQDNVALVVTRA